LERTKVDASSCAVLASELLGRDEVPEARQVVAEDVLLGRGEMSSSSRLKLLDVLLRHLLCSSARFHIVRDGTHVDEETEVGRVSPEADLRQLHEEQLLAVRLVLSRVSLVDEVGLGESGRELKDSVGRTSERLAFCPRRTSAQFSADSGSGTHSGGRRHRRTSSTSRWRSTRAACVHRH
jgi:hypothetical protein